MVYLSIDQNGLWHNNLEVSALYKRIRELREDNDLLQKQLAEYLHCSQVAYSRYELGTRDIPSQVLISLAKYYNTTTDYLLGLTDKK